MTDIIIESQYPYSYTDDDGIEIAFREGDRFILLDKSSADWWKVQRTGLFTGKHVCYIPAAYMKELTITPRENKTISPYANLENNINILKQEKVINNVSKTSEEYVNINSYRQNNIHKRNNNTIFQSPPTEYEEDEEEAEDLALNKSYEDEPADDAFGDLDSIPINFKEPKNKSSDDQSFRRSTSCGSLSFEISPRIDSFKSFSLPQGWKKCHDETGRSFYFNEESNERTWKPPRASMIKENCEWNGYAIENENGQELYVNTVTRERWKKCLNDENKTFYYNIVEETSVWELPAIESNRLQRRKSLDESLEGVLRKQNITRNSKCQSVIVRPNSSLSSNEEHSPRMKSPDIIHKRSRSNQSFGDISEDDNKHVAKIEKEGSLYRRKVVEGKKSVKKAMWHPVYCCKYGFNMVFYKDQKSASMLTAGKPDSSLDLHGAKLDHVTKEKAKKKNVFQISSYGGQSVTQFVAESQVEMASWITLIQTTIKHLEENEPLPKLQTPPPSPEDVSGGHPTVLTIPRHLNPEKGGFNRFKRLSKKGRISASTSSLNTEETEKEKTKIKKKLRKYLSGRPSFVELETQGIIKDYYFGCAIEKTCEREETNVPNLVIQLMEQVENRGLKTDGIYRVSGNLSTIQKLRVMSDHGETIDYTQPQWNDIHILAGALKLYFRELPNPLLPFHMFDSFIAVPKSPFKAEKIKLMKQLVQDLPQVNRETLHALINHLKLVMENSSDNRMQSQNLSIVFGPTLMWPESDQHNMAMTTIYQNQVIEIMLLESQHIFLQYY